MKKIQIDHLSFSHDQKEIFTHANLEIQAGQTIGLVGRNGSGKTTLFDLICGIRCPTEGSIINEFKSLLYLTQILTPSHSLAMSDIANLISALTLGLAPQLDKLLKKLETWAPDVTPLYEDIWSKKAAICSYGEKRSFFTLTLLAMNAELLILDEPTAGVDALLRKYIWTCINGATEQGAAIIVASHDINEITQNCQKFYSITQKKLQPFHSAHCFISFHKSDSLEDAFIKSMSN